MGLDQPLVFTTIRLPAMPTIDLSAFTAPQLSKLDAYLTAAILGGFADYDIGDGTDPRISIGFTVYAENELVLAIAVPVLGALFASPTTGRLTSAHGPVSSVQKNYYFTADVSWLSLVALAVAPFVTEIQLCANLAPRRPVPRAATIVTADTSLTASPPRTQKTTVLGLIDHGCPFAHRAYLSNNSTRVFSLWDQDPAPDFPTGSGTVPSGYGYGRQVSQAVLNGFITAATVGARVDEDQCYESAHYPAMKSQHTHGSIVMGLLASQWQSPSLSPSGRSELNPDAMDADVIFVQLPRAVPIAPNRGSIDRSTLDGLRYILDCAPNDSKISVVVDYGTELGPHDGTSWFERAVDAMVADARVRQIELNVIFPSGNGHEDGRHAVVFPRASTEVLPSARLGWWLPRGCDAPTPLELWLDQAHAGFALRITPPGGGTSIPLVVVRVGAPEQVVVWPTAAGQLPSCVVVSKLVPSRRGNQWQILVQLSPTVPEPWKASAASGLWMLEFVPDPANATAGPIHAYTVQGGGSPGLSQRVQASKLIAFADPAAVSISGDGSLLGSACGDEPVMVGSYEKWPYFARAAYSGGGLARGGGRSIRPGVDCLAVTEQSPVLGGLLCLGTRSASVVRMRGTSLATPQVARKIIALGGAPMPQRPMPTPSNAGTVKHRKVRAEYGEPRLP